MPTPSEVTGETAQPGTEDDRIDALRRAWLLEQTTGTHVRLQANQVAEIAYRLLKADVQPTMEAIRRVNGGHGSPNTIHPALKAFFARGEVRKRFGAPATPSEMPDALRDLWEKVVQHTRTVMEGEFAEQRKADERAKAELAKRAAELTQREHDVATRSDAQVALIERLEKEAKTAAAAMEKSQSTLAAVREDARTRLQQAKQERADQQREIAAATSSGKALQQQLIKLDKTMEAAHATVDQVTRECDRAKLDASKLREELAVSEATLRERKAGLTAIEQQLQALTATVQTITDTNRIEMAQREEAHAQALAALRAEREKAREDYLRAASALDERNDRLTQANAARSDAVAERDRLQAALTERERRVAELETLLRESRQAGSTKDKR